MKIYYENGVKAIVNDVVSSMVQSGNEYSLELVDSTILTLTVDSDSLSCNVQGVLFDKSLYEHFFDVQTNNEVILTIQDVGTNLLAQIDAKIDNLVGVQQFNSLDGLNGSLPDGTEVIVDSLEGVYTVSESFPFYVGSRGFTNAYSLTKNGNKVLRTVEELIKPLNSVHNVKSE